MPDIGELNELYRKAESLDSQIFAEQRSNILLVSGDHFNRRGNRYFSQIRDNRDLSDDQKLRLTQNHAQKIARHYENSILQYASGVAIKPQRQDEIQDQKAADLNHSVWEDARNRYRLDEHDQISVANFFRLGEVCTKIYYDPDFGELKGYAPQTDSDGNITLDETGQPIPDKTQPVFEGGFVFKELYAFNIMRHPSAQTFRESPVLIHRTLASIKDLKRKYRGQPDKIKMLHEDSGGDFIIFDAVKGGYDRSSGQVLVKEYYYKPSKERPNGYYYITTSAGILEEDELPFGIWPFVWQGFDTHATSARARSILKQVRPYQAEINRAASAMAMHQITIGDDKIIYQSGTKIAPGALLPGVRGISYQGAEPKILAGRDGSQYVNYIDMKIREMYSIVDLDHLYDEQKNQQNLDDLTLLYKSAKQRQVMFHYSKKFEQFKKDECELFLKLARHYYDDDMVIVAVGRNEQVNIQEFKNTTPLSYQITFEGQDDTIDTKLGRQISMMHLMQYAGKNLSRDDLGMIMRNMPYANAEEIFNEFTVNYDNFRNLMLAVERGEQPDISPDDDAAYLLKKLDARIKKPDFRFLHPQVQQTYQMVRQQYRKIFAEQEQKKKQAMNEYIPQDGPMIAVDMYVENKDDPTKAPKRARIPQMALNWLIKQLESQAGSLSKLEQMSSATQASVADMLGQANQPPGMPPGMAGQGMPPMPAAAMIQ